MINETPKNQHNGLENEKTASKKIYGIFIVVGGILLAIVLCLSLISFSSGDDENSKKENETNKLFSLLNGESANNNEVFNDLESNPEAEFSELNNMDNGMQNLLNSVGKNSNNDNGDCLDCQTQKKLKEQLNQCLIQCGNNADCKLQCINTYQKALDDYAQFNKLTTKEQALAELKQKLENCLKTCNGDKDCEAKCVEEYKKALIELERQEAFGENLIDSVIDGKNFEAQSGNGNQTLNSLNGIHNNNIEQNVDEKQNWWLTKDGFVKPRIIKGASVGILTAKPSGNDEKDKQKPLTQDEMEQKTLQALNKMIDNAQNIDYKAIMAANAEYINPIDAAANGINADVAYRQQSEFKGDTYLPTAATFSQFNQSLLMPKGTYIPCSLQTKIISELKGQIGCVVANDIYSANGQALLIEKGSFINGSYTNADVNDGSTRLYVVWSEIRTPNNVIIPVDSGASDPLGGSGIAGERDNHYLERFGAAILLSVIDGTIKSLGSFVNAQIAPNQQIYNPQQATQLANTALRQTINIKPTIYRNHGDLVGVYVNKDIDFSRVYQLRLKSEK